MKWTSWTGIMANTSNTGNVKVETNIPWNRISSQSLLGSCCSWCEEAPHCVNFLVLHRQWTRHKVRFNYKPWKYWEIPFRYDHAWSIANFTRKTDMENGEELKSGVFSIRTKDRQTDWFMRINPNGEEKTCKGFVSLFLYKDGNCEVKVNSYCWMIKILPFQ